MKYIDARVLYYFLLVFFTRIRRLSMLKRPMGFGVGMIGIFWSAEDWWCCCVIIHVYDNGSRCSLDHIFLWYECHVNILHAQASECLYFGDSLLNFCASHNLRRTEWNHHTMLAMLWKILSYFTCILLFSGNIFDWKQVRFRRTTRRHIRGS